MQKLIYRQYQSPRIEGVEVTGTEAQMRSVEFTPPFACCQDQCNDIPPTSPHHRQSSKNTIQQRHNQRMAPRTENNLLFFLQLLATTEKRLVPIQSDIADDALQASERKRRKTNANA